MSKRIEKIGNYTRVTDTVSSNIVFEAPTKDVRFTRRPDSYVGLFEEGNNTYLDNVVSILDTTFVDSADQAIADIYAWLTSNTGSEILQENYNLMYFDVIADGVQDDSAGIQDAIDTVIADANIDTLYIPKGNYRVDTGLTIDGKIRIVAEDATFIVTTAVAEFFLFTKTTDTDLTIFGLNVDATLSTSVNGVKFLNVTQSFTNSEIIVDTCSFLAYADELSNVFVRIDPDLEGDKLVIKNCITDNCVVLFFDTNLDAYLSELHVLGNTASNCPRWFLRSQSFAPATSGYVITNAWVEGNTVTGINANVTDKSNVARFVQVEVGDSIYIRKNIFDGSETTDSGNAVYMNKGSLYFEDNIVRNTEGSSSTAVIDDKGDDTATEFWYIKNNVFDQSGLTHSNTINQAIIRLLSQPNVEISGNTTIDLKTRFIYIYNSVDNGQWCDRIQIFNNKILDTDYPIIIAITQEATNIQITDNFIDGHTNSQNISENTLTHRRFISALQTFNNSGEGLKNLTVSGNHFGNVDTRQYLIQLYINAVAPTANMDSVFITDNKMYGAATGGSALAYFTNATGNLVDNMTNVVIANNVTSTPTTTESAGTDPADVTKQNNILT